MSINSPGAAMLYRAGKMFLLLVMAWRLATTFYPPGPTAVSEGHRFRVQGCWL